MACPKGKKTIWRYLEKLQLLLQRLNHQRRSKVLKSLTEAQRRDLEHWMLEYKSGQTQAQRAKHASCKPAAPMPMVPSMSQGTRRRCDASAATRGVISRRRTGVWKYFAVVVVHRLSLRTKEVDSWNLASQYHDVLLEIKEEISGDLCGQRLQQQPDEDLSARLFSKVRSILERRPDVDDLGLQFRAVVPIIGTNLTGPVFHLRTFHLGIAGWQFLQLARGVVRPSSVEDLQQTWDRSRHAVSELWAMAGRSSTETARRLDDIEKRQSFDELRKRRALQQQRRQASKDLRRTKMERQQQRLEERIHRLLMKFRGFRRLQW